MSKKILVPVITLFLVLAVSGMYAIVKTVPSVKIKNLNGQTVDTKTFHNEGKPYVINFWATWCKPCILELNNINDYYADWQAETGIKIIAVSIDDSRNSRKVAPFVRGRGWDYEIYLDENQEFKRALGVNNPPHTLLVDGNGEIVWEHNGYAQGDEDILYEKILELTNKE